VVLCNSFLFVAHKQFDLEAAHVWFHGVVVPTSSHMEITIEAPVISPWVSKNPVFGALFFVDTPSNKHYHMINGLGCDLGRRIELDEFDVTLCRDHQNFCVVII